MLHMLGTISESRRENLVNLPFLENLLYRNRTNLEIMARQKRNYCVVFKIYSENDTLM